MACLIYLRKCRVCGLEAITNQDLEKFTKSRMSKYERENKCKPCHNKYISEWDIAHRARLKEELIAYFGVPLICHFCGEEVSKLKGTESDALAIHSLDGNHDNLDPENKTPSHFDCHSRYHHIGRKHTPESRMKLRKASLGKKHTLETKMKLRKLALGRKHTPETIMKMRKSQLGEKSWSWKGNEASDHAKYMREWSRKRREGLL